MLERACDLLLRVQAPNRAECGRKGPPLLGEDKMDGLHIMENPIEMDDLGVPLF